MAVIGGVQQRTSRTVSMEGCVLDDSRTPFGELSGQIQMAPARSWVGNASTQAAVQAHASSAWAAHGNSSHRCTTQPLCPRMGGLPGSPSLHELMENFARMHVWGIEHGIVDWLLKQYLGYAGALPAPIVLPSMVGALYVAILDASLCHTPSHPHTRKSPHFACWAQACLLTVDFMTALPLEGVTEHLTKAHIGVRSDQ